MPQEKDDLYPDYFDQPSKVEVFEYLDALRESGETNMFGACPYLVQEFPSLTDSQARALLIEWMGTFRDE